MKYTVKLGNRTFEVEVDAGTATLLSDSENGVPVKETISVRKNEAPVPASAPETKAAAKPAPVVKPSPAPAPKAAAGGGTVCAPMPGMITEIIVREGQTVAEGDTIMILEAMKMENEIVATCDGTVSKLCAAKGQVVQTDDPLAEIS